MGYPAALCKKEGFENQSRPMFHASGNKARLALQLESTVGPGFGLAGLRECGTKVWAGGRCSGDGGTDTVAADAVEREQLGFNPLLTVRGANLEATPEFVRYLTLFNIWRALLS